MDYLYENLGDERFQEFCSNLISKEFQNIQTLPIGQPDGGRDSLVYQMNSTQKEFIVFQVKFVRNPNQLTNPHKWLTKTLEGETEKINKLIPKGATAYYLLTNVKGTAHLDSGSKDKVNKILEAKIKIPSICWWRDDLSILFEKDPIFKWSYPEILNGQDILNSVLFENLNENKERRESVIKAYLVDQFEIDNEVKFKQIDLQNRLLNLFTDVPIKIKKINPNDKLLKQTLGSLDFQKRSLNDDNFLLEENVEMGAAEFLLHPRVQNEIQRILLEGGPGQGKSTISQYICQVHRARLLNKVTDIELIPNKLKNTPIRLPFKVDLRDVATWIEKKNPYQESFSEEYFNDVWKNSLEAFLVFHIFYHSKLEEFNSTDFIAICKLSSILFVFDGFDEIANIKLRNEVIDFINKGVTRIASNTKSIQVIVTSRPAAFSDSVVFSIDNYPHFELTDITASIINEYVEKWINASRLDIRDAKDLRKLIKDKLEMPHLKDLAKSPMQLAIFISLLKTKGQSLPNKRTALYDSYIELFFDRESEKNTLVLEKRDLIIDIHQYLAWILHSEAELYKTSGSITINDLITRLKEYLGKEGHDTSFTEQLFDVMKERVCALVSRVQGTFEFEVQPLREYFCAKHLYKSAPHSSAGSIKQGTKPDRFNAILRNFYWQNVVRFFAGCADAGELDMIIQELKDLQTDPYLKYTNYPRIITSQILSDYVFTQKPLKLKDVVKIIVDGINIGNIINQDRRYSSNEPLLLPNECGRVEVIHECFHQLQKLPCNDYSNELISIINNNPLNNLEIWSESIDKFKGIQLTQWLRYGYQLQLIHRIEENELFQILKEGDANETTKRFQLVINGNRIDLIEKNIEFKQIVFSKILSNELGVFDYKKDEYSLKFLTLILHPNILSFIFTRKIGDIPFINHLNRFSERYYYSNNNVKSISDFKIKDKIDKKIHEFKNSISGIFDIPLNKFKKEIEPWDILIENARVILKDNWSLKIIATIAAGIKSKPNSFDEYVELHNKSLSLSKRVRCARMKSGNLKYWQSQLTISDDMAFTLLVLFTWATPNVFINLLNLISKCIKGLSKDDFIKLSKSLSITASISPFNKIQQTFFIEKMKKKKGHDEFNYIISLRFNDNDGLKYIYENIKKDTIVIEKINILKFEYLINLFLKDPTQNQLLEEIKKRYQKNNLFGEPYINQISLNEHVKIPYETAKNIMQDCKSYPKIIALLAEKACRLFASQNRVAVGKIANEKKWFENN